MNSNFSLFSLFYLILPLLTLHQSVRSANLLYFVFKLGFLRWWWAFRGRLWQQQQVKWFLRTSVTTSASPQRLVLRGGNDKCHLNYGEDIGMTLTWKCRFLVCFSCQKGGPINQAPWWKAACSCWTVTATASRTIQRGTTTTPSCPWTECDSGGCCVTSCSMSPTKKSRLTKWCWHPVAHTSMLCLQVS